jgi:hypothetical protein
MEVKTPYWMEKRSKEADWRAGRTVSTEIALDTYTIANSFFISKFNFIRYLRLLRACLKLSPRYS